MKKEDLDKLSKVELWDLVKKTEEKFSESNVRAAELIMELEQKNDEAEGIYKIVQNSLNEVYIFSQDDYHFLYANNGAQDNIGYNLTELNKLTPWDLKSEFDEDSFKEKIQDLSLIHI